MKKGWLTVLFMVVITFLFIAGLAFVNEVSSDRISRNRKIADLRSLMYACDIHPPNFSEASLKATSTTRDIPWDASELLARSEANTRRIKLPLTPAHENLLNKSMLSIKDSVEIILIYDMESQLDGYGFRMRGKGLWGTITAVAVVSKDMKRMLGIDFIEQVETPGLGARIMEKSFKIHFRNLQLSGFAEDDHQKPPIVMVRTKPLTNQKDPTNTILAITGATQTCNGVLRMLNTDLRFYLKVLQDNQQILRAMSTRHRSSDPG